MSSEPTCAASPCTYPPYCLTPALAPQHVPHPHVDGGTGYRTMTADHRPSIPPPPPPPPPKIKSRSYFERFVAQPLQSAAYASRPPSVQAHRANADVAPLNPLVPKLLGYVYFHSSYLHLHVHSHPVLFGIAAVVFVLSLVGVFGCSPWAPSQSSH